VNLKSLKKDGEKLSFKIMNVSKYSSVA